MDTKELFEQGMKLRRQVLGDAHVEKRLKQHDEFGRDWQEFQTTFCWGRLGAAWPDAETAQYTRAHPFGGLWAYRGNEGPFTRRFT